MHKLYMVEVRNDVRLTVNQWGHDCQYAVVVRAHSYIEARKIAAIMSGDEGKDAWFDPRLTKCRELLNEGKVGLVIRDFLNG